MALDIKLDDRNPAVCSHDAVYRRERDGLDSELVWLSFGHQMAASSQGAATWPGRAQESGGRVCSVQRGMPKQYVHQSVEQDGDLSAAITLLVGLKSPDDCAAFAGGGHPGEDDPVATTFFLKLSAQQRPPGDQVSRPYVPTKTDRAADGLNLSRLTSAIIAPVSTGPIFE